MSVFAITSMSDTLMYSLAKSGKEGKVKESQPDEGTTGADVGKIVNLMAIDANTVSKSWDENETNLTLS